MLVGWPLELEMSMIKTATMLILLLAHTRGMLESVHTSPSLLIILVLDHDIHVSGRPRFCLFQTGRTGKYRVLCFYRTLGWEGSLKASRVVPGFITRWTSGKEEELWGVVTVRRRERISVSVLETMTSLKTYVSITITVIENIYQDLQYLSPECSFFDINLMITTYKDN